MRKVGLVAPAAVGLAVVVALVGCRGPAEISIGAAAPTPSSSTSLFLSPTGSDQNPGTRARPWRTFRFAVPRLVAGATLTLLDGTYDGGTTGYLDVRCGVNALAGDANVTVRADHERAAFLRGDASGPPLFIDGCAAWTIEGLRVESDDLAGAPDTVDAGSVVVVGANNRGLVLRRLLARRPNRFKHSHVLRIGDGSTDILVEECELYDFHHNAFETWRTSSIVFRRNYVNARGTPDIGGGYVSEDATRGDFGFLLEETRGVIAENNVVEGVHDGFGIVGRYMGLTAGDPPPAADPLDSNRLLGNVVLQPAGSGVRLDSRCLGENPCTEAARTVLGTELRNDVVVGGSVGVSSAGAVNTQVRQLSVIGAANGLFFVKEPQNVGVRSSSTTLDSLVAGFQGVGFRADGETDWSFDHCAAVGGNGPVYAFQPDDGHVTSKVTAAPALGGCLAYLPASSPLKGAGTGAGDVGASVLDRYEAGQLTATPLWNAGTGAFPCGAVVAGVNDDPATSCLGVHTRLHIAAPDCPLP